MNNSDTKIYQRVVEILQSETWLVPEGESLETFAEKVTEEYYQELEDSASAGDGYHESLEKAREILITKLKGRSDD